MKLVTILDEGRIPWTNIVGPVFGYPMTDGQYSFLTKTNVLIKLTTPEQAKKISESADGVIVGSAIVKLVAKYGKDCVKPICDYVREMKNAMN